jgi:hypothetical protein
MEQEEFQEFVLAGLRETQNKLLVIDGNLLSIRQSTLDLNRKADLIMAQGATLKDLDAEIANDLANSAQTIINAMSAMEQKLLNGQDVSSEIASVKAVAGALRTAAQGADGSLAVDNATVSLSQANTPTAVVNASEDIYTGVISVVSDNPGVCSVSPASGNGPGPLAITITATGVGSTTVEISDDHGGKVTVGVSVTA